MKKLIFILACCVATICSYAIEQPVDTVIEMDGYRVRAVLKNDSLTLVGLEVFSPEKKAGEKKAVYDFIESALLAKVQDNQDGFTARLTIRNGELEDFKNVTPDMQMFEDTFNGKVMSFAWDVDGHNLVLTLPVGYDMAKRATRGEIENGLIALFKNPMSVRRKYAEAVDTLALEAYGDSLYILPGGAYQNRKITRDAYFINEKTDSVTIETIPVWDSSYPEESIANLFVYPSDRYGERNITLRIMKHEYGDIEEVTLPVDSFIAICEQDGCEPYFGVEKYENGSLQAAVLLPNQTLEYTHVLVVRCNPADVIEKGEPLKARTSLYVPVNNIDDLFAPYVKKTEKEKIKYEQYLD